MNAFSQCFSFFLENPINFSIPMIFIQLQCSGESSSHLHHFFSILWSLCSQQSGKNEKCIPPIDFLLEMCVARHDARCSLLFFPLTSSILIGPNFSKHLRTVSIIEFVPFLRNSKDDPKSGIVLNCIESQRKCLTK